MRNRQNPRKSPAVVIAALAITAAAIVGILFTYYQHANNEQRQQLATLGQAVQTLAKPVAPPPVQKPPVTAEQATTRPAPVQEPIPAPTRAEQEAAASEPAPLAPPEAATLPPALDGSDTVVAADLWKLPAAPLQSRAMDLLVSDQLLRRFVSFVNNLAAGKLDHENDPFKPIKGNFRTTSADNGALIIAPESYQRYNIYADILTSIDAQRCAQQYRRYYALLQNAQAELGVKGSFHGKLLAALDMLIATPDIAQPVALLPMEKHMHKFADPKLETLPAAQKLIVRSGPDNAPRIKAWLGQLRIALASQKNPT